jgi:hypothetical protein
VTLAAVAMGLACTRRNPAFRPGLDASAEVVDADQPDRRGAPAVVADPPAVEPPASDAGGGAPVDAALALADAPPDLDSPDRPAADLSRPDNAPDQTALPSLPGLVGYWKLDEAPGSRQAADSSGNGHVGTLDPSQDAQASWTSGRVNGALFFPFRAQAAGVAVAPTAMIRDIQRFTFTAWTRRTTLDQNRHMTILSRQLGDTSREVYSFTFDGPDLVLYLYPSTPGDTVEIRWPLPPAELTRDWIHVAASYDGTQLKLFVSGTVVKSQTYSGTLATSDKPLFIGTNKNTDVAHQPWDGWLDEVALWSLAIPDAVIAVLASGATLSP